MEILAPLYPVGSCIRATRVCGKDRARRLCPLALHLQFYIGMHDMPGSKIFLRRLVEASLLTVYHPAGNYGWAWSPQDGLTHRCYT